MPSPQQLQAAQRLATVKTWLIEMGWTAQLEADGNATPIRAMIRGQRLF